MNSSIATSFVSELEKLANLSRLAFGPMPKAVAEKTVAKKAIESTKALPSHLSIKARPSGTPRPAKLAIVQGMIERANRQRLRRLGKWKPGMTPHQEAMAVVPKVKVAGVDDFAVPIAGALAGGAVGDRVIRRLGGRFAMPIGISTSLAGSMLAGDAYAKAKYKARMRKRKQSPQYVYSPGSTTASGRRMSQPTKREIDEYMQRQMGY